MMAKTNCNEIKWGECKISTKGGGEGRGGREIIERELRKRIKKERKG